MKKILTLTYSDCINYGALLQAYALKEFLRLEGYDCHVIDYHNRKTKFSQVKGLKKLRSFVWNLFVAVFGLRRTREKRTKQFREQKLDLTAKSYSNIKTLHELNEVADVFIVGSDQVWSERNNAGDKAYLLSFVSPFHQKIAYAASFGSNEDTPNYLLENKDFFGQFSAISVREKSASVAIEKHLNTQPPVVMDPVFLLTRNQWLERCLDFSADDICEQDYILCYVMPGNDKVTRQIYKIANKISNETGCRIITLGKKPLTKPFPNEKLDNDCGPEDYLKYILYAKYIVTNSFHGTALSIVFRKNFWTVLSKSNNRNVRIESILDVSNLQDRCVYSDFIEKDIDFCEPIDYTVVNDLIDKQIRESKKFLIGSIEGEVKP